MPRLKPNRTWLAIVVLTIVLAQFPLVDPLRDQFRLWLAWPTQLLDHLGIRLVTSARVLTNIGELAKENAALRAVNLQLQAQLAALEAAKSENERLRQDLNFQRDRPDLNLLPAQVISFSPTGLRQSLVIDKGQRDGVRNDQAVISSGFLVGRVRQVSEQTADVWLLTNRNLITPVQLPHSQTLGILKSTIRGLVIDNIPLDTKIAKGEPVVTSSLEGIYPPGIAVGQVEEIISPKEDIFLTLRVSNQLKLTNLTTVFVVR